jgi:hypothetical protein
MDLDITKYSGEKVKIAFFHTADTYWGGESTGWYIDDVSVSNAERIVYPSSSVLLDEDFESGLNGWGSDNGLWQVGTPTVGPSDCHSGTQCAGTLLDANYSGLTDSRFISPSIPLMSVSGQEEIHLMFWQYFSYSDRDGGNVQISVWDDTAKQWSGWTTISSAIINVSTDWTNMDLDITKYSGEKVKIAFYHTADTYWGGESTGWYIDDVIVNLHK